MNSIVTLFTFYKEGFQNMSVTGKKLWVIIFFKLLIMFGILKVFFFKNYLDSNFSSDKEKIEHVTERLTTIE